MRAFILASIPVILSWWLMAAHFLRSGNILLVFVCFFAPALLVLQEKWAARALQVGLILGSFEWLATLVHLVQQRLMMGRPYIRLTIILGVVTTLTFASAFVFLFPSMRRRFQLHSPRPQDRSPVT